MKKLFMLIIGIFCTLNLFAQESQKLPLTMSYLTPFGHIGAKVGTSFIIHEKQPKNKNANTAEKLRIQRWIFSPQIGGYGMFNMASHFLLNTETGYQILKTK